MATFAQYSLVAAREALKDAGWEPKKEEDLEATVSVPMNNMETSKACAHTTRASV